MLGGHRLPLRLPRATEGGPKAAFKSFLNQLTHAKEKQGCALVTFALPLRKPQETHLMYVPHSRVDSFFLSLLLACVFLGLTLARSCRIIVLLKSGCQKRPGTNASFVERMDTPGAVLLRELLKKKGHVSKQTGRRPPRFGGRTKGTAAKKAKVRYTGRNGRTKAQRKRLDENPTYLEKSNRFWKHKFPKLANLLKIVGRSVCLKGLFRMPKKL